MQFNQVLNTLLKEFEQRKIRYAVTGGFAVGALGVPRATMDLDFVVHRDDLKSLDEVMFRLGYRRGGHTENVSMYLHPDPAWGRIDCLHAFRKYTLAMLERAVLRPIFEGTQTIRVLAVEDVIGLKVQGIANNPIRRGRDQVDIEALMSLHSPSLDWTRIQEYYELFDLGEEARQLRARFGHAQ